MLLDIQDALRVGEVTNWVDIVAIVVMSLFFFHGLSRGFTLQLVGIVVLALCLICSTLLSGVSGEWLRTTELFHNVNEKVAHALCFGVIFIVTLILGSIGTGMMKGVIEKASVIPYDRFFGGVLAAIKAVLLIMVVVIGLVNLFYDQEEKRPMGLVSDVIESRSASATRWTAENVGVFLPEELAEVFKKYAERLGTDPRELDPDR
jgi:uncharacterized membrane protein required for colicin V production